MRVILTGSTAWADADAIRRELARLPAGVVIVHGDCAGVDALGGEAARELGLTVERWSKDDSDAARHGDDAWKGLNERMLGAGADLVLTFHPDCQTEGKALGCRHLMAMARVAGVEIRAFHE